MNRPKTPGMVFWFTGLSAAGKTSIANCLLEKFREDQLHPILLDGDQVRLNNQNNDYSDLARINHNLAVGSSAAALERKGHIVLVSLISPFSEIRKKVRQLCSVFIEVYIDTPLEECIRRDPKGMYKKALAGEIKLFTGISSPYEPPENPEIRINTKNKTIRECAEQIYSYYKNPLVIAQNSSGLNKINFQ